MRLSVLLSVLLVSSGCSQFGTPDVSVSSPKVEKPAKAIESDSEAIKTEAVSISEETRKIDTAAETAGASKQITPHTENIRQSVDQQKVKIADIQSKTETIKSAQPEIDKLRQKLKTANQEKQKVKTWLYTGLKLAGLVAVGIGLVIALRLNMATGISISVAGIGITTAAQLWQLYWQWLVGGLAVLIVAVVGYSLYSVIVLKDAWWRDQNAVPKQKKHEKAKQKAGKS